MANKQLISITDRAASQIQNLLQSREKPALGIKVGVKAGGCSGLSYKFEYAEDKGQLDEVIEDKGVTVFIDPTAVMYLIGTQLDYVDEKVRSGFVFINPNEKGRCGCGKSFHV